MLRECGSLDQDHLASIFAETLPPPPGAGDMAAQPKAYCGESVMVKIGE